jgi:hypothetical protein
MTEELSYPMHNFITNSLSLFVFKLAFKYFILFLQIEALLHKIKYELVRRRYHFTVAKLSGVEVLSIHDGYLVINLDVVIVHEFL